MKIFIREIRKSKGMRLCDLSRKTGIASSHICNIENGVKSPSLTVLCKLAKALEVPCSDLFSCDD